MVQSRLPIPANSCFNGDEMRAPDVLYIGYPKTASTFIREFLAFHPAVYVDRRALGYITAPNRIAFRDEEIAAAAAARCYVSMYEKIAEGLVFDGSFPWNDIKFDVSSADRLHGHLEVSPSHWAQALRARFPQAKALIIIRDQVDWLGSAYRWYVSQLAKDRRSFLDFCETPKGITLLRAGHYDLTIRAYREAFGDDSVMVLRYETLRDDRARFLDDLCRFLEIEPLPFEGASANVGRSALVASLHARAPWAGSLPRPIRSAAKKVADKIAKRVKVASLSETERRFIRSAFAASNLNTEALLAPPKTETRHADAGTKMAS